jgi:hypothetical protein
LKPLLEAKRILIADHERICAQILTIPIQEPDRYLEVLSMPFWVSEDLWRGPSDPKDLMKFFGSQLRMSNASFSLGFLPSLVTRVFPTRRASIACPLIPSSVQKKPKGP